MSALTLVVMAAGIGSRFGGIKQIEPVGPNGELIVDYSIYDALEAGFERIVYVIRPDIEREFRDLTRRSAERTADVRYAFQTDDDLPKGLSRPEGRTKPWGTVHALMAAERDLDGPFAAINADDCYGPRSFELMAEWLRGAGTSSGTMRHSCVLYEIGNAIPRVGAVTRGLCEVEGGRLTAVKELRGVERTPDGAAYRATDGTAVSLAPDALVSMNFWGLDGSFVPRARSGFEAFLRSGLERDPMGCEYLLPELIDRQIHSGEASVDAIRTDDLWYGVTYREDLPQIRGAIASEHASGARPTPLWGDM